MKDSFLQKQLTLRAEQGLLRKLSPDNTLVDFSSNDYLGFARSPHFFNQVQAEVENIRLKYGHKVGSTGSRLLSGNSLYAEELENKIATYHQAEAGLLFNSGYNANLGLLSSVPQKEDFLFYDELSHASIYDGVRLSKSQSFPFKHNDLNHLQERLQFFANNKKENTQCFVVAESVYSMDGDFCPLQEMVLLCEKYNAHLMVDEAHATGLFGERGEGRVVACSLQDKVFARVHTFGKALGCHGAIVLGSISLRNYLLNFARPFIYTTALSFPDLAAIYVAYNLLYKEYYKIIKISNLVSFFKSFIKANNIQLMMPSSSPIQSVLVQGNRVAKQLAEWMQNDGFDVRPILSPTVPKGKERIRICLHAFNTREEVEKLILSVVKNRLLLVNHNTPL